MERKIRIDNIVRVKLIGTTWMKVTHLDYEFDEEANTHFLTTVLNTLDSVTVNKNLQEEIIFSEEEHKICYVICEWYDTNGKKCEGRFKETDLERLEDIPNPPSPKVIEGFIKAK